MSSQLTELLNRDRRPRVLVVGDVMLDRYLWGDVDRISPEAPIPVLRVAQQEHRLGGAGSVAAMLAAMEAEVLMATAVGDDTEGRIVRKLLWTPNPTADNPSIRDPGPLAVPYLYPFLPLFRLRG